MSYPVTSQKLLQREGWKEDDDGGDNSDDDDNDDDDDGLMMAMVEPQELRSDKANGTFFYTPIGNDDGQWKYDG